MSTAGIVLLAFAMLFDIVWISVIQNMHDSDPAGNGMSQAYGMLLTVPAWIAIAILLWMTASKSSAAPLWSAWAAFVLVPAWGAAALAAVHLLSDSFYKAKWPIAIPVLGSAALFFWILWLQMAPWQSLIPARVAALAAWGVILAAALAPWPAVVYRVKHGPQERAAAAARYAADEPKRREEERLANRAAFDKLTLDAPVRAYLDFTYVENPLHEEAFARIRKLSRRQAEIETLFRQGYTYLLRDIAEFDVEATPPICDGALKYLAEKTREFTPLDANDPPKFENMVERVEPLLPGLRWLASHGCDCRAALAELERSARIYRDSGGRAKFLSDLAAIQKAAERPAQPPNTDQ